MKRTVHKILIFFILAGCAACASDPADVPGFPSDTPDTGDQRAADVGEPFDVGAADQDAGTGDGNVDVDEEPTPDTGDIAEETDVGEPDISDAAEATDGEPTDAADSSDGDDTDVPVETDTTDASDADSTDVPDTTDATDGDEPDVVCPPATDPPLTQRDNCAEFGMTASVRVCLGYYEDLTTAGVLNLVVENDEPIHGFQFKVAGVTLLESPNGVYGGRAATAGFSVDSNHETGIVAGYNVVDASIEPGSGTLVTIQFHPPSGVCPELCLVPTVLFGGVDEYDNVIELDHQLGPCFVF